MIGLTHKPTGFRIHAPRHVVRGRVKAAFLGFFDKPKEPDTSDPYKLHGPWHFDYAEGLKDPYAGMLERQSYVLENQQTKRVPAYLGYRRMYKGGPLFISDLNTVPDHRNQGLARRLMQHMVDTHGHENIFLEAEPYGANPADPKRLNKFYKSLGFTRTGSKKPLYVRPGQWTKKADLLPWVNLQPQQKRHAPAHVVRGRATQAFTYVPADMKEQILREGLYSSKALLRRPDLFAAVAKSRGEDPEQWRSDIKERLKGWKPESSQGPSVLFHEPPDVSALPENHPLKRWPLARINVDLDAIMKNRPKSTRVHGVELRLTTRLHIMPTLKVILTSGTMI